MVKKWRLFSIMFTCSMMMAASNITLSSNGIFLRPVSEALGVGIGSISLNATICLLLAAVCNPIAIKLADRVPIKLISGIGVLLVAGSTLCMGYAKNIIVYSALGIFRGVGYSGFTAVVVTTVMVNWFKEKQVVMTGISMALSGTFTAVCIPLLSNYMELHGYQATYILCAILTICLSIPFIILFLEYKPNVLIHIDATGTTVNKKGLETETNNGVPFKITSSLYIWICVFAIIPAAVFSSSQHLPAHATEIGASAAVGALMTSGVTVGGIISNLLIGYMNKLFRVYRTNIIYLILGISGILLMICKVKQPVFLIGASLLIGFVDAVFIAGSSGLVREVYGNKQYGKAYSFVSIIMTIGEALSISLVGYVYDLSGSYNPVFIFAVAMCVLGVMLLLKIQKSKKNMLELQNKK